MMSVDPVDSLIDRWQQIWPLASFLNTAIHPNEIQKDKEHDEMPAALRNACITLSTKRCCRW